METMTRYLLKLREGVGGAVHEHRIERVPEEVSKQSQETEEGPGKTTPGSNKPQGLRRKTGLLKKQLLSMSWVD